MSRRIPVQTDVVLRCGCITTDFGSLIVLGEKHEEQFCDTHNDWYRVLRKASESERFRFFVLRQAIPRRATSETLGELLRVSKHSDKEAERIRHDNGTLF